MYLGDSYKLEISKDEQQVILKNGRLILPATELRTAGEKSCSGTKMKPKK